MKSFLLRALPTASLCAIAPLLPAQPGLAKDPPPFGLPFNPDGYYTTAAFDLSRGAGVISDWTGWVTGDPTGGNGHAYDDHSGTDTGMVTGTNLYAVANGTVSSLYEDYPTDDHSGGGNYMIFSFSHAGETYLVNNWHLNYQGALKSAGQSVTRGELVGLSDNTGNSTGPHLHLGIARSSATGNYTCGYYHGWWEIDEFYYGNTRPCLTYVKVDATGSLNCRLGASTSYGLITVLQEGGYYIASQRNGWWRIFLPMPPARAVESRAPGGALASGYSESGTWVNDAARTSIVDPAGDVNVVTLTGTGSRYSTFSGTGGADSATYAFTTPQYGNYKVMATWPGTANAQNVTYRVTHAGGTTDVLVNQTPATGLPAGTGTHANPYLIEKNLYVANHTTVGGDDTWNSYSPTGSGISEAGPERIYKFTVTKNQNVTVTVDHTGYPTKDIDVHLLTSLSNTACVARSDWTFTYAVTPGTYYIACDSYGTTNNAATNYTLTVKLDGEPFANDWVNLGEFLMNRNTNYSVQVLESSVTGVVNGSLPGRVYTDALKLVPVITTRSGWCSDQAGLSSRVNTSTTPLASVVVSHDSTVGNDSRDLVDYKEFPVYASPGVDLANSSAIVAKVVTGQRFVCRERTADGWYKIDLTTATGATQGWISGVPLIIYNASAAPIVSSSAGQWIFY
ncbi:peptidoglycan DD-metalloendopeptidase family protein [Candidatus Sumerlaeota bacterium]|nr:peptidoglycan DD-metalloendopeptidase family protein [Candidatus Sumerlaeota bacterium]